MNELLTKNDFIAMVAKSLARLLIPNNTVGNIFTETLQDRDNPLMEGYFATYDIETVAKYLRKRYKENAIVKIVDNENGVKVFDIVVGDLDVNQNIVDKDMSLCGYFPSVVEKSPKTFSRLIRYEPRHQSKVNEKVQETRFLYHFTQSNKVSKILKNGLESRTNNKYFTYPDRIYLMLYEPTLSDIKQMRREFERASYIDGKEVYRGEYCLLRVDCKGITNDFFYDPNALDCVYTKENIPQDRIKVVMAGV